MSLSRRRFITMAGGVAGAAAVGGGLALRGNGQAAPEGLPALPTQTPTPTATTIPVAGPSQDRVLVVVQLGGGNDGLNTLVPMNDGRYRDARPTLAIAESDLVALDGSGGYGLHPSLAPMGELWDSGQLAAIQAVGLPEQSRSHFVALDTWWGGAPGGAASGGWLGRWMDATTTTDPDPMRAIALGGGSPALIGQQSTPIIVQSLSGFDLMDPSDRGAVVDAFVAMADPPAAGLLGRAQGAIPVAVDAVSELKAAFAGSDAEDPYGNAPTPALFDAAADIIAADLGAQVILINLGGFDTHANQLTQHANLLDALATGVSSLFGKLTASGHADRTLLMSYSEFGRRVSENGSGGTDHGNGGLALLMGPPVAGSQVVGELDLVNLDQGDVARSIDSRSLYANALSWLGGPVDDVLGGTWDTYDLVAF